MADHVTIGDGAIVGAQSGVPGDVDAGARLLGSPARPARQARRILATGDSRTTDGNYLGRVVVGMSNDAFSTRQQEILLKATALALTALDYLGPL